MKRKLWLLAALTALLLIFFCGTSPAEVTTGTCGDSVQWSLDSGTGTLSFTGTGPIYDYSWSDIDSTPLTPFESNESITSVTFSPGITAIGSWLLDECCNLTSVTIPDTVTRIGEGAFYKCDLAELTLPGSVEYIGAYAFCKNGSLHELVLPEGLRVIDSLAFCSCIGLNSVSFPASLTVIGYETFKDCPALTGVFFSGKAPYITSNAFLFDTAFAYYHPDESWTEDRMTDYGGSITWVADGAAFCGENVYWTKNGSTLIVYGTGPMADYQQTGSVSPLAGTSGVSTAVIRDGITRIGTWAFSGCTGLTRVDIPESVTAIGANAFSGCTGLTIRGKAGSAAQSFAAAGGFSFVTLPDAEGFCGSLTWELSGDTLTIRGQGDMINFASFDESPYNRYRSQIAHVVIEPGVLSIGQGAFSRLGLMEDVSIPASVKTIGGGAFMGCQSLTGISLPDGLTFIGDSAFYNCSGLTAITIPAGVTRIDGDAFTLCKALLSVRFLGPAPVIDERAFAGITAAAIYPAGEPSWTPDMRKGYGGSLSWHSSGDSFCGDSLVWTLSGGMLTIEGKGDMWNFDAEQPDWYPRRAEITSVVVGTSITSIGKRAFAGCANLSAVIFEGDAPNIAADAFSGVTATVSYISENTGWTADVLQNYGGTLTWTDTNPHGRCGQSVNWSFDPSTGTLTLSGTGPMWDYDSTNQPYRKYREQTLHIIIEPGVTHIGNCAFYAYYFTSTISIGDGVETVGEFAFSNTKVEYLAFPDGVTSIGDQACYWNSCLTAVTIPASVTGIGKDAFGCCYELNSVIFLGGAPAIGDSAFYGVTAVVLYPGDDASWTAEVRSNYEGSLIWMNSIVRCGPSLAWTLEDGVLSITGMGPMWDFETEQPGWYPRRAEITSVVVADKVTRIGKRAFTGCVNLSTVNFEGDAPVIAEDAFLGVTADAFYQVIKTGWTADVLQNYGGTVSWIGEYPGGPCGEGVNWSFRPDTLTLTISGTGPMADYGSTNQPYQTYRHKIRHVIIEPGVTHIGDNAFRSFISIWDVSIGEGVETVGERAFMFCDGMTSIVFPEGVTSIGEKACYLSDVLTEVTIPASVQTVGNKAFYGCGALSSVTVLSLDAKFGDSVFPYENDGLKIYGYAGSTAEACAGVSGINFVNLSGMSGSCGEGLSWVFSGNTLIITGEGAMSDQTADSIPYREHADRIEKVVIRQGVTHIGSCAFQDFTALSVVSIPDSVLTIGSGSFRNCTALSGLTLPESLTGIAASAFQGSGLNAVIIPVNVTDIGQSAFSSCSGLSTIRFIGNGPSISADAFSGVTATAHYINGQSGWTAERLQNYGGTITWVADEPHGACGDSVSWFLDTTSGTVTISGTGSMWDYDLGASRSPFFNNPLVRQVVIEPGVTSIGGYSFYLCTQLTSVSIPESVTAIRDYAFYYAGMSSVLIPESVTSLNQFAFAYSSLAEVVIPASVTQIGTEAFYECGSLAEVTVRSSGTIFGTNTFGGCLSGLILRGFPGSTAQTYAEAHSDSVVFVPFSVGSCGSGVTWTLTPGGDLIIIGTGDMDGYSTETEVPWYDHRTEITSVVVSQDVTGIGRKCFSGCSELLSVSLPGTLREIGASAFNNCSKLERIAIPEGVTTISESAFWGCSKLADVSLPGSVTVIGNHAFRLCSSLAAIDLPDSLTILGGSAFFFCSKLSGDIVIPSGVTVIPSDTFWHCEKLESVVIPEGVTRIGDRAFQYCTALESVMIYSMDAAFGTDVFDSCSAGLKVRGWPLSTAQSYAGSAFDYLPRSGKYGDLGSCYWKVTDGTLRICGEGPTPDEDTGAFSLPWYAYRNEIDAAVVEDGITRMGRRLFSGLPSLIDVQISDTVTSIGSNTFLNSR